ncbi:FLYWCH zinc finger domain-containing protein [Phthorimaea operculella]|nr:FLYWCH zinc finger domain-containing protein [Phthorimaea operculella]
MLFLIRSVVTLVQNRAGKTLALYGGYTFYLHDVCRATKGWPCTRTRCRARLTTTNDGVLLRATGHHDHEPPRYENRRIYRNFRRVVCYVQNKSGKTVALYGGHTFYLHDRHRSTQGWPCTRPRCRARLTTTNDGVLLRATGIVISVTWARKSNGKEVLLFGGFSYCLQWRGNRTDRWVCTSSSGVRKCRARLLITKDRKISNCSSEKHAHPPPKFIIRDGRQRYIKSRSGKTLLLVGDYTFCAQRHNGVRIRWSCSTHNSKQCRANIHTVHEEIVKIHNVHNHPPVPNKHK